MFLKTKWLSIRQCDSLFLSVNDKNNYDNIKKKKKKTIVMIIKKYSTFWMVKNVIRDTRYTLIFLYIFRLIMIWSNLRRQLPFFFLARVLYKYTILLTSIWKIGCLLLTIQTDKCISFQLFKNLNLCCVRNHATLQIRLKIPRKYLDRLLKCRSLLWCHCCK